MDELEGDRLAPLRHLVLVDVRLGRSEALLRDLAVFGDEASRGAVVAALDLALLHDALADEVVGEHAAVEHQDRRGVRKVGDGLRVGIGRRVPHHDLRVLLQRRHQRDRRLVGRVLHRLVVAHVAEQDRVVGVELCGHLLEADGRAADADLDLHAGVDAAARHELTGHGLGVRVDLGVGADELIQAAVLGLGVPVGLHDHGVGTDAGERCRVASARPCRRCAAAGGGRPAPGRRRAPARRRRRRVAVIPARGEEQEAGQRNREPGCLGGLAHVPSL